MKEDVKDSVPAKYAAELETKGTSGAKYRARIEGQDREEVLEDVLRLVSRLVPQEKPKRRPY